MSQRRPREAVMPKVFHITASVPYESSHVSGRSKTLRTFCLPVGGMRRRAQRHATPNNEC